MLTHTSPAAAATGRHATNGYGPLVRDPDGLLDLPRGFRYRVVTRAGDALKGQAGTVPGTQDGTASFPAAHNHVLLVNNHEQEASAEFPVLADSELTYDPGAVGGTTTIEVDAANERVSEYVSLAGTYRNCAGGKTPWQTWLSCEETEIRRGNGLQEDHGFVFEVDPANPENNRSPAPLKAMGRFSHESVAIDPQAGICYQTEDASGPNGLFYRFTPHNRLGDLHSLRAGGRLEATRARGVDDLSAARAVDATYPVRWQPVPDPLAGAVSVRNQFSDAAITRSRKLEGTWWGDGGCYFVASYARTEDGSAEPHDGQVWFYDPFEETMTLKLRMAVTPDADDLDGPDNITVSPHGGVVVAEDGGGFQHLFGSTDAGSTVA